MRIIPGLILGMLTVGMQAKKIYEKFIKGAKEGFGLAVTIIPYLVAILAAAGMFRKSGGWTPSYPPSGRPRRSDSPPRCRSRRFDRSRLGAYGITAELIETHGQPTSESSQHDERSTETTFYVLAVYFGSVGVSRIRHAVPVGLAADFAGVVASVIAVKLLLGG